MLTTEPRLPTHKPKTKTGGKRHPARDDDLALSRDKAGVIISQRGKDRGPTDAHGDPIAKRHAEFVIEGDDRGEPHLKRLDPSPLDRYKSRNELGNDWKDNQRLWSAGDRFRTDCYIADFGQRITADLGAIAGGSHPDMPPKQVAAQERVMRALRRLPQPLDEVVTHVVWWEGTAADWARNRGWPQAQGLGALKAALDILSRHYGEK